MDRELASRLLIVLALVAIVIGALDPLEGSLIILPGITLAALAAFIGQCRWRRLLYCSFGLVVVGVAALFVLSSYGGAGGNTGRSNWWLLVVLPYPVGWVIGLVGTILTIRELFKRHPEPA